MRKLLFLVLITLALALLPVMVYRGDLWLSSDFVHQEISFILETKRMLATGAPWWSWNTYLGSDFIGSYAFYTLTSPFVWINCLLPESLLEVGLAITFVLKFLCISVVSWLYLRKMGVSRENSLLGSFLFTFSSFNIASLYYYHFYEPIIAFILLLIAIERLLRHQRWGMACVALAAFVVTFVNFYFAIGSFIAALIYVIFRAFSNDIDFNVKTAIRGLIAVAVGVVMCSFLLLPVFNQMLITTRTDAQSAIDSTAMLNLLERLRTVFMPKVVEGRTIFVSEGSDSFSNEASIAVFGLSLAFVYVWRHRDWLSSLLLLYLLLYLSPLNGIFTLFTNPLYTRWAYALTIIIVLCTVRVLDERRDVKRGVVSYSIVASVIVFAFVAKVIIVNGLQISIPRFLALIALFLIGIAAIVMWSMKKISLRWLKVSIVACVIVQIWLFMLNLGTDSAWVNGLKNNVEQGSGEVTCRTDFRNGKSFLTYNAGLLRNRASVQSYHSVITKDVDVFLRTYTKDFWAKNKLRANIHQDELDALLSVKEIYEMDSTGNVAKRENKFFIPMGFAYDKYLLSSDFYKMRDDSLFNLPLIMLSAMVVDGNYCDSMERCDIYEPLNIDSLVAKRREYTTTDFKGNSRGFTAKIDLPSTRMVFFSIPYSKGFTARVDGKDVPIYKANWCMMALKIAQGKHSISVEYFPPGLKTGAFISIVGLLLLMLIMWSECKNKRRNR
ncbi:MAG: YfhO family protein [Muribaculaceae bacterium]|nr:YfhO family protein [Muribaculaceae bacterium]